MGSVAEQFAQQLAMAAEGLGNSDQDLRYSQVYYLLLLNGSFWALDCSSLWEVTLIASPSLTSGWSEKGCWGGVAELLLRTLEEHWLVQDIKNLHHHCGYAILELQGQQAKYLVQVLSRMAENASNRLCLASHDSSLSCKLDALGMPSLPPDCRRLILHQSAMSIADILSIWCSH